MKAPFFSIILPTYNRASFIERAIESVTSQTFHDFELIIIDDGSTDDTSFRVSQVQDPRVKYYKKLNEERSIARNFGISKAHGNYINFLDSDDKFYPHHLVTAFRLLSANGFPEVYHLGYETINEQGVQLSQHNNLHGLVEEKIIHENILCCNAIFIQRNIAIAYPFPHHPKAVMSEDWYVWLRLSSRYKIHYENVITSSVIEHQERSLRNINPDKLIESSRIIVELLKKDEVFKNKYGKKKVNYFFSNLYTLVTLVLALTKKRRFDTVYYLLTSLKFDYSVLFRKRFLASIKHIF